MKFKFIQTINATTKFNPLSQEACSNSAASSPIVPNKKPSKNPKETQRGSNIYSGHTKHFFHLHSSIQHVFKLLRIHLCHTVHQFHQFPSNCTVSYLFSILNSLIEGVSQMTKTGGFSKVLLSNAGVSPLNYIPLSWQHSNSNTSISGTEE